MKYLYILLGGVLGSFETISIVLSIMRTGSIAGEPLVLPIVLGLAWIAVHAPGHIKRMVIDYRKLDKEESR